MIFVCLGSQKFQFNRLLEQLDIYKESNQLTEPVFVQKGYSDYSPKYLETVDFLNSEEFKNQIDKSELIITHGGTGAIINSIKKRKKVIAIPRLSKYGEHVDDHQIEIVKQFDEMELICPCYDVGELINKIEIAKNTTFNTYQSNTDAILNDISSYINAI